MISDSLAQKPRCPFGGDGAGPGAGQGAVGDGVHQVPVEPHGDRGSGQACADVVFAAGEEDMSVTLDLAVNFCGLPGGN
jgi:hypothetical protein